MPTYLYICTQCEHRLEAFQKITDAPLELCPQCKKKSLQREIGGQGATLQTKGLKKTESSSCSCCHSHCSHRKPG